MTDPELAQVVGNAVFLSITYRLFKLPEQLESLCEDYGQVATYKVALSAHNIMLSPLDPACMPVTISPLHSAK